MTNAGHWFPDPTGRNDRRYWDGASWTSHVTQGGVEATDSISPGYAGPEQFRFREDAFTRRSDPSPPWNGMARRLWPSPRARVKARSGLFRLRSNGA